MEKKDETQDDPYLTLDGELTERSKRLSVDKRLAREAAGRRIRQRQAEQRAFEAEARAVQAAAALRKCEARLAEVRSLRISARALEGEPGKR